MGQLIEFPDCSFYQGNINWNMMRAKTSNIILRCSQGNWKDSMFLTNYPAAKAYGLRRGVYHFFDDRYSPQVQVNMVLSLISNDRPEQRVWVDWENLSYHEEGTYKGLGPVVEVMKGIEKALPGVVVGMYTGYYWFEDHTNPTMDKEAFAYLSTHPYWLAQYTSSGSSSPLLVNVPPWSYPPELHQYGTPPIGPDYGVETIEIDMNRVLKNQDVYGGPITPDPEPNPGDDTMVGKVLATVLNIRKQPNSNNTTNPPIGKLQLNDIITADFETQGWWHLTSIARSGVAVALPATDCYAYEGENNGYIDDVTPHEGPRGPQEVRIKDEDGNWWVSTDFSPLV